MQERDACGRASAGEDAGAMLAACEQAWRPLGQREDLDVDLAAGARTVAVSELLAACLTDDRGETRDRRQQVLRLTLAGRIGALSGIVALTEGASSLELAVRCPQAECGETFAVELSLDELRELAADAERQPTVEVGLDGRPPLRLRRPTGEDQLRWQRRPYAMTADAERAMLESLLEGDRPASAVLEPDVLTQVADAMEEIDPLPSFLVVCPCTACDAEGRHAVDLELALLRRLQRRQRDLIGEVHRLAQRYGWTEGEALALPAWRRRAYLEMIEAEAS